MKESISIYENGYAYFGKDPVKKGFSGECPVKSNHLVIVIFNPNSTIDERIESLNIVVQDLKLQQKTEAREAEEAA